MDSSFFWLLIFFNLFVINPNFSAILVRNNEIESIYLLKYIVFKKSKSFTLYLYGFLSTDTFFLPSNSNCIFEIFDNSKGERFYTNP